MLLWSIACLPVFAQPDSVYLSPEMREKFADHLFCSGDYFRSALEYEAVYTKSPDEKLFIKYMLAQWKCGNGSQLAGHKILGDSLFGTGYVSLAAALNTTGYAGYILPEADEMKLSAINPSVYQKVSSRVNEYYSYVYNKSSALPQDLADEKLAELNSLRQEWESAPHKSPLLAGIFSALIPGSGKIYTGETGDGITAFILTSLFGYLAYTNFEHEHKLRAWIFTAAGTGFYLGNIYGSVLSAGIKNRQLEYATGQKVNRFLEKNSWFLNISVKLPCFP